jgi:hypothetical protein
MTLLVTEIHNHDDPDRCHILFAADGRLSIDGTPAGTSRKILKHDSLGCGLGYFGLASWFLDGKERLTYDLLSEAAADFGELPTLRDRADHVAAKLNTEVPPSLRQTDALGVHLAGFELGKPEFWYIRNLDDAGAVRLEYFETREDFQREHAARVPPGLYWTYRNGDLRAHEEVWDRLECSFKGMFKLPGFRRPSTVDEYAAWVKFKMGVIADFYDGFCEEPIIGRPVAAFAITAAT